jgi:glycosyltransferase involved in cell wall biosynthesis
MSNRVLIIIPCFNEENSIGPLLNEISILGQGFATLVIDDGSEDKTFTIAAEHSTVIRLSRNLGIGGAVQTGIKFAKRNGFDYCVQIDGDGQHLPEEITKLINHQVLSGASIIIGSRYLRNSNKLSNFQSTFFRRIGSQIIAFSINKLFSTIKITDPTSGMRLMDKQAICLFTKYYPTDYPEPISLAWALKEGLKVDECPVLMRPRISGSSSISGTKSVTYMLRVLCYLLITKLAGFKSKTSV